MALDQHDHDGHFANYAEYSKTFRSWMVAYGIGGPILLLLSKDAPASLSGSPSLPMIITLFIFGVALQIALALINKWAAWQMYRGAFARYQAARGDPDYDQHERSRTYKVWCTINRQSWFDFICDVTALTSFSVATWLILQTILAKAA